MTILLRRTTSENNRLDKVFISEIDKEFTGYLREAADVLTPKIKIETSDDLSRYNYAEISDFHRKYFISVQLIQKNIWEISCEVDVLSTYASQIKECYGLVKRTAKKGKINYYMNDGVFYTEQRQIVTHHAFKKSGEFAKLGTENYYLLVAGG